MLQFILLPREKFDAATMTLADLEDFGRSLAEQLGNRKNHLGKK